MGVVKYVVTVILMVLGFTAGALWVQRTTPPLVSSNTSASSPAPDDLSRNDSATSPAPDDLRDEGVDPLPVESLIDTLEKAVLDPSTSTAVKSEVSDIRQALQQLLVRLDALEDENPDDPTSREAEVETIRQDLNALFSRLEALETSSHTTLTKEVPDQVTELLPTNPSSSPDPLSVTESPSPASGIPSPGTPTLPSPTSSSPPSSPTPTARSSPVASLSRPLLELGTQTISLPGDVLFDFNKATLRPEAAELLNKVAKDIQAMPSARILVAGHTDNVGTETYNLALSLERANAVQQYLMSKIPDKKKYSWKAEGYGFSQPVASNDTPQGQQQNRRVDLIIAP
jgi:outer membrane protein OmpA-like peptidoglycan-associated protein